MDKIEKSIIQSLELIKREQNEDPNENQLIEQDDNPDILIKDLSKLSQSKNVEFDFIKNKPFLDDIYFKNSKLFKIGSKDHSDFWSFLSRYQNLLKKKSNIAPKSAKQSELNEFSAQLKLPLKYDKRWRLNFVYKPNKSEQTGTYDSSGNKIKFECDEQKLREFEFIIHLYLDFLQKEKYKKLKQLRQAQANLPIYKYQEVILKTVKENQVTIIAGDTGCGKSTQIPRYLLEVGFERIACTQPRRIACMSLAKRVSYETLNEFKSEVAYQVRFDKTRTKHTKILFLTEGVLLRQIQSDAQLGQYDIIVVDEVHERHVFTDFLLGILKCLIKQRQSLKVILMSATINIDLFSNYFDQCVIVKIPGRTYKIDVEYMPANKEKCDPKSKSSSKIDPAPYIRIMQQIDKKYPESERGDMLHIESKKT